MSAPEKAKPGRPRRTDGERKTVITLKGSAAWKGWLDRLAYHSRVPVAVAMDLALTDWAKKQGFSEPPPER